MNWETEANTSYSGVGARNPFRRRNEISKLCCRSCSFSQWRTSSACCESTFDRRRKCHSTDLNICYYINAGFLLPVRLNCFIVQLLLFIVIVHHCSLFYYNLCSDFFILPHLCTFFSISGVPIVTHSNKTY